MRLRKKNATLTTEKRLRTVHSINTFAELKEAAPPAHRELLQEQEGLHRRVKQRTVSGRLARGGSANSVFGVRRSIDFAGNEGVRGGFCLQTEVTDVGDLRKLGNLKRELELNYQVARSPSIGERATGDFGVIYQLEHLMKEPFGEDIEGFLTGLNLIIREMIRNLKIQNSLESGIELEILWRGIVKGIDCVLASSDGKLQYEVKSSNARLEEKYTALFEKYTTVLTKYEAVNRERNARQKEDDKTIKQLRERCYELKREVLDKQISLVELTETKSGQQIIGQYNQLMKQTDDYLLATERERETQIAALNSLSHLISETQKSRVQAQFKDEGIQTEWAINQIELPTLPFPILSYNPITQILKSTYPPTENILETHEIYEILEKSMETLGEGFPQQIGRFVCERYSDVGYVSGAIWELVEQIKNHKGAKEELSYLLLGIEQSIPIEAELFLNDLQKRFLVHENSKQEILLTEILLVLNKAFKHEQDLVSDIIGNTVAESDFTFGSSTQPRPETHIENTLFRIALGLEKYKKPLTALLSSVTVAGTNNVDSEGLCKFIKISKAQVSEAEISQLWAHLTSNSVYKVPVQFLQKQLNYTENLFRAKEATVERNSLLLVCLKAWMKHYNRTTENLADFSECTTYTQIIDKISRNTENLPSENLHHALFSILTNGTICPFLVSGKLIPLKLFQASSPKLKRRK